MILSGKKAAILQNIQIVDIHSTRYYDVAYVHIGEDRVRLVRLGSEAMYDAVQPGDQVEVSYMMGVAVGIARVAVE